MALFDSIISEAAQKFGLGSKAAPLLSETLKLMTDQQNGGLAGFIDRFRQAGLGDLASSWISTCANQPLSENQVQNVLGNNVISQLASKVGLSSSVAIPALAYMIPKVIDYLTPNGTVPTGIPSAVSSFLSGYDDLRRPVIEREERTGGSSFLRWLPLLLLIPLIILGYRYCNRTDTM